MFLETVYHVIRLGNNEILLIFGSSGTKVLLVFTIHKMSLFFICSISNLVEFAVLALASGKISLKASEITALVKIAKILTITFNTCILAYHVNTYFGMYTQYMPYGIM